MSELIKNIQAAIRELPLTDSVHCYDYEIRTDDLHTLCDTLDVLEAEHARSQKALKEIMDRYHQSRGRDDDEDCSVCYDMVCIAILNEEIK